jgi:GDP-L-fucose synthase
LGASPTTVSRRSGYDLRHLDQALRAFETRRPEMVINCAANQGGIGYQALYPGTIYFDNLLMGANTMEAARLAGVSKYINIVAGCAYPGEPLDGILRETEFEAGAMHATVENYGATKRAAVMQARVYRRQYAFDALSLILINLYGPGEHFEPDRSHGLAALLRKFYEAHSTQTDAVVLWGTGAAVREWLYVDDATTGILLAAEHYAQAVPLNIAVGQGMTIAELAAMIKGIVGYQGQIVFDTSKPDGARYKTGSTEAMESALGWRPATPIREGLAQTLAWLESHYAEATLAA